MVAAQVARRRPALSTVGKGARGLLGLWDGITPLVIAGTAIAQTENKLHVLELNREENAITPLSATPVSAEVWSMDMLTRDTQDAQVTVAARRGCDSSVELWQLKGLSDLHLVSSEHPDQIESKDALKVVNSSSLRVEGEILKVCRNAFNPGVLLSLTPTGAAILDASQSLKQSTSVSVSGEHFSTEGDLVTLVSADWINTSTALVASQKSLGVVDVRTGRISSSLNVKKILEASKPDSSGFWLPPHPSRLVSACSDRSNVVYAGSQDGCIRAFDIRANDVVWEAQHAVHQWVSAVCHADKGIISGATNGVVRCWTRDGTPIATFPQHDDTVTNISCCADYFAAVSYDERIAINEMPVGG